jgi:type I restriction enzyme M protein
MANHSQLSSFIWQIAELLRGPYRPNQYERVILPLLVLRRFDCILAPTKQAVLAKHKELEAKNQLNDTILNRVASGAGEPLRFHNHSPLNFEILKSDPQHIVSHLDGYINGFSENVRLIFERFDFNNEIRTMNDYNILYLVVSAFAGVDLHPDTVSNHDMGILFEGLIRDFNEANNQEAGDYFTPRDVIELMVDVLFSTDDDILRTAGKIATLLDPTCGTGGMLSEAQNHLFEFNQSAELYVFGQDYNPRSYAVAASDLLIKGNRNSEIRFGDSLTDDQFPG